MGVTKLKFTARDPKPFLKWAGGKRAVIPKLIEHIPAQFNTYVEPFVGAGALFFSLKPASAILNDANWELIQTYRAIRDLPGEVVAELSKHHYDSEHYYAVRRLDPRKLDLPALAARMIYLNRTGYNGLYRVNSRGQFNVPFGKYVNPKICDRENIFACSEGLKGVMLENFDFREFPWDSVTGGDFVYFDPPYIPLSDTSNFTSYSKTGFAMQDQEELADLFRELDRKGVKLLLTNSGTEQAKRLYAGFNLNEIEVARAINSKGSARGGVPELVVSNY